MQRKTGYFTSVEIRAPGLSRWGVFRFKDPHLTIQIVYRPIAELIPFARNSRTHSDAQVAQIASSIREFGFTNPVLVDGDNGIIAGHGRLAAARVLDLQEVPCIVIDHLTDAQKRALVITDNKLALNAGWNFEMLASEIEGLKGEDFDVSLLGFDDTELADLLAKLNAGQTDPDETPEPPAIPASVPGDAWVLGRHRLVCGDSTDADTVATCLNGVTPHLMVTDPPYGVKYDPEWRARAGVNTETAAHGKVLNDDNADWREAWALFPGDVAYIWHAGLFAGVVADSLTACGFHLRSQIVWDKGQLVLSRGDYHWEHEPCWYAVRKGATGHWAGDRKQTTVWRIAKPSKSETGHGTQKPVECMKRPIENNSSPGQAIYEPFSESGTTIIAGEMSGRSVHAIELNPAYVDVGVLRWQQFTGLEAVHAETGQTFAEMASSRTQPATAETAA